jgi:hypothetical protein
LTDRILYSESDLSWHWEYLDVDEIAFQHLVRFVRAWCIPSQVSPSGFCDASGSDEDEDEVDQFAGCWTLALTLETISSIF